MDIETLKDVFKNKFLIFSFIVILFPLLFFNKIDITQIIDLQVTKNATITVGEGEPCRGFNLEVSCGIGLECILTSTSPIENGVCLKEGTVLEDDPILRNILIRGDDKDVVKDNIYSTNINYTDSNSSINSS